MAQEDDGLFALYNERLIALAAQAAQACRIPGSDATARAVSPICGSEVSVDLKLKDSKISDFGFEVEACALTKTVVAIMRSAIIGKSRAEVRAAGEELAAMLEGKGTYPSGDWAALSILEPVKDYRARHNAILLPFEAVEKAFKERKNG